MLMKIDEDFIYAIPQNKDETAVIKSWHLMKRDKAKGWYYGKISYHLLSKIRGACGGLIPAAMKKYKVLKAVKDGVDKERVKPESELVPMTDYPVKRKLYSHQIRAANMCMMTFGMI